MTIEQLRSSITAQPFLPFNLRTGDGRALLVPHPDFISTSPSGRTIIVYRNDDSFSNVDLLLVHEIEVLAPAKMASNQNGTATG